MPHYEGIGLVGDKHAIVLDIGVSYTKCGFAGENGPRCIIPSEIYDWKSRTTTKVVDLTLQRDEQKQILIKFLRGLYKKYLLVNSRDRRVVVVESVLCPTEYRDTLAQVMFEHFEVPSLVLLPSVLSACFTIGTQNALVVDIGFTETVVMPIFDGVPMLNCCEAAPIGAKAIHECLRSMLSDCDVSTRVGNMTVSECPEIITESIIEDIIVRTCFVTHMDRGRAIQASKTDSSIQSPAHPPDVDYPLEGDKILKLKGSIREGAFEELFEPDVDGKCLPTLILDSIQRCPIDLRRPMVESILMTGGSVQVPGFMSRIKAELLDYLGSDEYSRKLPLKTVKFFKAPCKQNYTAWLGGAIFGALEILPHRSISREAYTKDPKLPDWTTFQGATGIKEPNVGNDQNVTR